MLSLFLNHPTCLFVLRINISTELGAARAAFVMFDATSSMPHRSILFSIKEFKGWMRFVSRQLTIKRFAFITSCHKRIPL
ncbi:hypothetical protein Msip34_1669 [Methylovorus glucosotrophus SIP3-4]|uniref:Uncharacterized protein n=1 Tax=Methylovorus glucosotrophus (strain SIP3-4) TaxID=582744 RepID=C6XED9_METGS|nr:hypothetical protein Msip34_1669 [Methylovorus glucosotrophus SIP3-4]